MYLFKLFGIASNNCVPSDFNLLSLIKGNLCMLPNIMTANFFDCYSINIIYNDPHCKLLQLLTSYKSLVIRENEIVLVQLLCWEHRELVVNDIYI